MTFEFQKVTFLKVYTGEDVLLNDKPLYKAIIEEAQRLNLSGGTVSKGIGGFATERRGLNQKIGSFLTVMPNLPIMVEIVDTKENIEKMFPFLVKNAKHALVLVEESSSLITDYTRQVMEEKNSIG